MFSFPLVYLLIPFGLMFGLATMFFFFNVFHIRRYAIQSRSTTLLLIMYFVSFGALVVFLSGYIIAVDWTQEFEPRDLLPSFESSSRIK